MGPGRHRPPDRAVQSNFGRGWTSGRRPIDRVSTYVWGAAAPRGSVFTSRAKMMMRLAAL